MSGLRQRVAAAASVEGASVHPSWATPVALTAWQLVAVLALSVGWMLSSDAGAPAALSDAKWIAPAAAAGGSSGGGAGREAGRGRLPSPMAGGCGCSSHMRHCWQQPNARIAAPRRPRQPAARERSGGLSQREALTLAAAVLALAALVVAERRR